MPSWRADRDTIISVRWCLPGIFALLASAGCHARNPAFCPIGVDPNGDCLQEVDAANCVGVAPYMVCVTTTPTMAVTLTHVDTTGGCDETITLGRELCVVEGTDVTVAQHVTVRGTRPLVLFATGTLTVTAAGDLDASGTTSEGGAGADLDCNTGTASTSAGGDGGGGAGGSFGTIGARGGNGGGGSQGSLAGATIVPPSLQGGCSGTDGSDGMTAGTHGSRGFGGGGIYLVAAGTLEIDGVVNASGAGGARGLATKGGAGGGGSGGMIVLYAPTLVVQPSAQIFANGGGGGGGANNTNGSDGTTPTTALSAPAGGIAGGAGTGGAGAFSTTAAQPGLMSGDGGGGGGGGVGVVYSFGDISTAQVSPAPS